MKNKEKNFISAVVYVRNDEKKIANFLKKVNEVLNDHFLKYEIIFVNDASLDNSTKILKDTAKEIADTTINIVNMSFYQGREMAMNAGLDLAIGDFVYMFDSINIDYDLDMIMNIYKKSLEGFDIVSAKPKKKLRFSSKVFYHLFNKYSKSEFDLTTDTFRILSRRAINRIHSMNKTIPYRKALYVKCGLQMTYVPYEVQKCCYTKFSKLFKEERKKNASDALILFTDLFYKISLFVTVLMLAITFLVGTYTIVIYFSKNPVAGWTTTMLFLSFCFFILFVMISIILKYLSLIISLLFKNQKYLVASIDKLN